MASYQTPVLVRGDSDDDDSAGSDNSMPPQQSADWSDPSTRPATSVSQLQTDEDDPSAPLPPVLSEISGPVISDAAANQQAAAQARADAQAARADAQATGRRQKITGELLSRMGVGFFTDLATGEPTPVTDSSGQPLTNFDKRTQVGYDSSGQPQKLSWSDVVGRPTLVDPYQGAQTQTDPQGNIYATPAGLPWKQVGTDPNVAASYQAAQQAKATTQSFTVASEARVSELSNLKAAQQNLADVAKTTASKFQTLGLPVVDDNGKKIDFGSMSPDDLRQSANDSLNAELNSPEANEKTLWGSGLTQQAQSLRTDIERRRGEALSAIDDHQTASTQLDQAQHSYAMADAQEAAIYLERLARVNATRAAQGMSAIAPLPTTLRRAALWQSQQQQAGATPLSPSISTAPMPATSASSGTSGPAVGGASPSASPGVSSTVSLNGGPARPARLAPMSISDFDQIGGQQPGIPGIATAHAANGYSEGAPTYDGTTATHQWSSNHSDQWNQMQQQGADAANAAGLPAVPVPQGEDASRTRLMDAINRAEAAGYAVPHAIGTAFEGANDRGVTKDQEGLVAALKQQQVDLQDRGDNQGAQTVARERAYWQSDLSKNGMSAADWISKGNGGAQDISYPAEELARKPGQQFAKPTDGTAPFSPDEPAYRNLPGGLYFDPNRLQQGIQQAYNFGILEKDQRDSLLSKAQSGNPQTVIPKDQTRQYVTDGTNAGGSVTPFDPKEQPFRTQADGSSIIDSDRIMQGLQAAHASGKVSDAQFSQLAPIANKVTGDAAPTLQQLAQFDQAGLHPVMAQGDLVGLTTGQGDPGALNRIQSMMVRASTGINPQTQVGTPQTSKLDPNDPMDRLLLQAGYPAGGGGIQSVSDAILTPSASQMSPEAQWTKQSIADAKAGKKPYTITPDDKFQMSETAPLDSLTAAVQDGVIPSPDSAVWNAAVQKQKMIEAAGSHPEIKAALAGAGRGAAFLSAMPVGAGIAASIPVVGELPWGAGEIVGGAITGGLASWGYGKALEKLGQYNSTINSFVASQQLHPWISAAADIGVNVAGLPRALMGAAGGGLSSIADALASRSAVAGDTVDAVRATINASKIADAAGLKNVTPAIQQDAYSRAASALDAIGKTYASSGGGLAASIDNFNNLAKVAADRGDAPGVIASVIAKRVALGAAGNLVLDSVINDTAQSLGLSKEGETPSQAVTALLLGAVAAGHGISREGYSNEQLGDIWLRGSAHLKTATDLGDSVNLDQLRSTPGVNPAMATPAMAKPLTPEEQEIFGEVVKKAAQLVSEGKIADDPSQWQAQANQILFAGRKGGIAAVDIQPKYPKRTGGTTVGDPTSPSSGSGPLAPATTPAPSAGAPSISGQSPSSQTPIVSPAPAFPAPASPASASPTTPVGSSSLATGSPTISPGQQQTGQPAQQQPGDWRARQPANSQQQSASPRVAGAPDVQRDLMAGRITHGQASAALRGMGLNDDDITRAIGPAPAAQEESPATQRPDLQTELATLRQLVQRQPVNQFDAALLAAERGRLAEVEAMIAQQRGAGSPGGAAESQPPAPAPESAGASAPTEEHIAGLSPERLAQLEADDARYGQVAKQHIGQQVETRSGIKGTLKDVGQKKVALVDGNGKAHAVPISETRLLNAPEAPQQFVAPVEQPADHGWGQLAKQHIGQPVETRDGRTGPLRAVGNVKAAFEDGTGKMHAEPLEQVRRAAPKPAASQSTVISPHGYPGPTFVQTGTDPKTGLPNLEASHKAGAATASPGTPTEPAPTIPGIPQTFTVRRGPFDPHFANHPLIQAIANHGGLLSRSGAQAKWSPEKWADNKGEWDDVPHLAHPSHNQIYKSNGLQPDEMAAALTEDGLLKPDAGPPELWKAIHDASESSDRLRKQSAAQSRDVATAAKQGRAFDKDALTPQGGKGGAAPIPADHLQVGDIVDVHGEKLRVTAIDPDTFDVTLEDHTRYGVQQVEDGKVIYGKLEEGEGGKVREDTPDMFTGGDANTATTPAVTNEQGGTLVRLGGQVVAKLRQTPAGQFAADLNPNGERLTTEQKAAVDRAAFEYSKQWQAAKIREGQGRRLSARGQGTQDEMFDNGDRLLEQPANYQPKSQPFYSQLTRTLESLPQETMTVAQAKAAITKGAKPDEIAQQGMLTDPLSPLYGKGDDEKVSKSDLLDYSLERQAHVQSVTLGTAAFGQFTLPGAEPGSYREMFATWPEGGKKQPTETYPTESGNWRYRVGTTSPIHVLSTQVEAQAAADVAAERSRHWSDGHVQYQDIRNPIVRIRRNIRTDADGRRTYFIEEIQGPSEGEQAKMPPELRKRAYDIGMKMAIRDAIDHGCDAIGWTTGDSQVQRYDLSRHVAHAELLKQPDGKYLLFLEGLTGQPLLRDTPGADESGNKPVTADDLSQLVGKDTARELIEGADKSINAKTGNNKWFSLPAENLKVGGEGLRNLYDTMLPRIANKLAAAVGGKVTSSTIPTESTESEFAATRPGTGEEILRAPTANAVGTRMQTNHPGLEYDLKRAYKPETTAIHSLPIPEAWKQNAPQFSIYEDSRAPQKLAPEAIDAYVTRPDVAIPQERKAEATHAIQTAFDFDATPYRLPAPGGVAGNEPERGDTRARQADAYRGLTTGDVGAVRQAIAEGVPLSSLMAGAIGREVKPFNIVGAIIESPRDLAMHALAHRTPYFESVKAVVLDNNNQVIHSQLVHVGALNESLFDPKAILHVVAQARALNPGVPIKGFLISHNHPSGDPTPSNADLRVNSQLVQAAKVAGEHFIDHVIGNGETYFSMMESGNMDGSMAKTRAGEMRFPQLKPGGQLGDLAPFEAVPTSQRPRITPDGFMLENVVNTLRTADPHQLHILALDTRNKLIAALRYPMGYNSNGLSPATTAQIMRDLTNVGAYGFAVSMPTLEGIPGVMETSPSGLTTDTERRLVKKLQQSAQPMNLKLIDAMGMHGQSYVSRGLLEQPPTQPTPSGRVREEPGEPDELHQPANAADYHHSQSQPRDADGKIQPDTTMGPASPEDVRKLTDDYLAGKSKPQPETPAERQARTDGLLSAEKRLAGKIGGKATVAASPGIQKLQDQLDSLPKAPQSVAEKTVNVGRGVMARLSQVAHSLSTLPQYGQVLRAVNEYQADLQRVSKNAQDLAARVKALVGNDLIDEAITNWRQAGGDLTTLSEWASRTGDPKLKAGYLAASELTPEQKALARDIGTFYDEKLALGKREEMLQEGIANYATQVWVDDQGKRVPTAGAGKFKQQFAFANPRQFDNFFEGEQMAAMAKANGQPSFHPLTKKASELMGIYSSEFGKVLASRDLIKKLANAKAADGRAVVAPSSVFKRLATIKDGEPTDAPSGAFHLDRMADSGDYRLPDHPAFQKWKWTEPAYKESTDPLAPPVPTGDRQLMMGNLLVHPEHFRFVNNVLGTSAIRQWLSEPSEGLQGVAKDVVGGILRANGITKGLMFVGSPFHAIHVGKRALGNWVNPFSLGDEINLDDPFQRRAIEHGLVVHGDRVSQQQFVEGVGSDPLIKRIPGIGPILNAASEFTFHTYIPRMKMKTYAVLLQRKLASYEKELRTGAVTVDQLEARAAYETNNIFGHLNYAGIGRNPTVQHVASMLVLAPDFTESTFRGYADAFNKHGGEARRGLLTLAIGTLVAAKVINALLDDGNAHLDHPFSVVVNGREYSLRSPITDLEHLFKDWWSFANGRQSPILRALIEGGSGKNWRGEPVSWTDRARDILAQPIPSTMRAIPGVRSVSPTDAKSPIKGWEQFVSSLGVGIRRYSPSQDVHKWADDYLAAHGQQNPQTAYPQSKFANLKYALFDGKLDDARKEYQALLAAGQTPQKVQQGLHASLFHPVMANKPMLADFEKGLSASQRATYAAAAKESAKAWQMFQSIARSAPAGPVISQSRAPAASAPHPSNWTLAPRHPKPAGSFTL